MRILSEREGARSVARAKYMPCGALTNTPFLDGMRSLAASSVDR